MSEKWKPKKGEMYWYVWNDGTACWGDFTGTSDERRFKSGNCFKTEAEAEVAAEKVKALLLSLHSEPVADCNQLPKLTAEVFSRPDCPVWAKIAVVNSNGKAYYGHYKAAEINSSGGWCGLYEERGKWERIGNELFDASDWQNSLIEHPAAKLPDWCKPGAWIYTSSEQYLKINGINIDLQKIELSNGATWSTQDIIDEAVSARLRPYNAEEMRGLVGKVICGSEGKLFMVLVYSPNTVYFGKISHTPEDLILDIYKFPDGSPCGVLEHLEEGEWVR